MNRILFSAIALSLFASSQVFAFGERGSIEDQFGFGPTNNGACRYQATGRSNKLASIEATLQDLKRDYPQNAALERVVADVAAKKTAAQKYDVLVKAFQLDREELAVAASVESALNTGSAQPLAGHDVQRLAQALSSTR